MFGIFDTEKFNQKTRFETSTFREPTDGSLRYTPHGAMPGNPFYSDALKKQQAHIDEAFLYLFEHPNTDAPEAFQKMLIADHEVGEQRRKMKNFEAFSEWVAEHEPITDDLYEIANYVETGKATIGEELDFALNTKIKNIELGKVTHPYAQRFEHVAPFRLEAEEAIAARGGIIYPKVIPYRSLAVVPNVEYHDDGTHTLNGFIIRYKRDFGHIYLPNGEGILRIVERQIAGVRVDEHSGFSEAVKKMMEYTPITPEHTWQDNIEQYLQDTGCLGFIERNIQADTIDKLIVPISTTLYAFKEPHNADALKGIGRIATGRPTEDEGIAYFGPPHSQDTTPINLQRKKD